MLIREFATILEYQSRKINKNEIKHTHYKMKFRRSISITLHFTLVNVNLLCVNMT